MGNPQYSDDPTILDGEVLYRRVPSDQWHWPEDRPQSGAFDDSPDGSPMSVAVQSKLLAAGLQPRDLIVNHPKFGLVSFTAGSARQLGFAVTADPPVAGEPGHGWVVGKKTTSRKRQLAKACQMEVRPLP